MPVITVDGASGVGKSTIAKAVAEQLSGMVIDTGEIIRAATVVAMRQDLDFTKSDVLRNLIYSVELENFLPTDLYADEIEKNVGTLAAHPGVQDALTRRVKDAVDTTKLFIVVGRSIGVDVFPDAELKVFLTASNIVRVLRKAKQYSKEVHVQARLTNFRDKLDQFRPVNPLRSSSLALNLDTSDKPVEVIVQAIVDAYRDPEK